MISARSLFALMSLVSFAASNPINVQTRDIFDPPVIIPDANTVWQAGSTQTVVWDASNPPKSISNGASIRLRLSSDINFFITLASGFSLLAGNQTVQLPSDLEPATDYFIILFGDSGNVSPDFTIIAA